MELDGVDAIASRGFDRFGGCLWLWWIVDGLMLCFWREKIRIRGQYFG